MNRLFKRVMVFILSASISIPVFATDLGIDITVLLDDQLLALRSEINQELAERSVAAASVLYPGVYVVGRDITEGQYVFRADENVNQAVLVDVYADEGMYQLRSISTTSLTDALLSCEVNSLETVALNLANEQVLVITNGSGEIYANTQDWVPGKDTNVIEASQPEAQLPSTPATGIRPEVKEAIDAYETVMNGYIEFMSTYDTSDFTALGAYIQWMSDMTEASEKFNALEGDLTDEEYVYYLEVLNRVNGKLIQIQ